MLEYIKNEANMTLTENGAVTLESTGSECLDLFATIGALRRENDEEIVTRFIRAYSENADTAMKLLFYARDIRGGLGERRVFRVIMNWLADHEPKSVLKNLEYVSEFGRFDDLLSFFGTKCEKAMLQVIEAQLKQDIDALENGSEVSLLAKWLPSVNASNADTVKQAKAIAKYLKMSDAEYRKTLVSLRNRIRIIENNLLDDYLHDVEVCQAFARRSREKMAEIILERTGMTAVEAFHTIHNYIDTNEMILRKGAIAAHKGEKVLIPINMRDGSVIAIGRGNPEWNCSAPHGAGRIMSRTKAKETLDMKAYKEAMAGIYTTSVNEKTIDEAPMAYKSLDDIIDVIRDSVDIIDIMKPVYNFKASDDDLPWKKKKVNTDEGTDCQETETD